MKSASELALDKTAPDVPAAASPVKVPAGATPESLDKQAVEIRAAAEAKIAEIHRQLNQVNSIREPLGRLLLERERLLTLVGHAEKQRAVQVERADAFRRKLHEAFSASANGAVSTFFHFLNNDPSLPPAARLVEELDLWLADRRKEVPAIDAECKAYAVQHKLTDLLPAELR